MVIAEFILAWSTVLVAFGFAARLIGGPGEDRYARGIFRTGTNHWPG